MSIDTAITRFRAKQAQQFTDTVTVRRYDPATYTRGTGYDRTSDTVYSGGCKIRPAEARGSEPQTGERERGVLDFVGKFPVDTGLARDDEVEVTASSYDAGMVGQRFKVTGVLYDAWQIARVVALEMVAVTEETGS